MQVSLCDNGKDQMDALETLGKEHSDIGEAIETFQKRWHWLCDRLSKSSSNDERRKTAKVKQTCATCNHMSSVQFVKVSSRHRTRIEVECKHEWFTSSNQTQPGNQASQVVESSKTDYQAQGGTSRMSLAEHVPRWEPNKILFFFLIL